MSVRRTERLISVRVLFSGLRSFSAIFFHFLYMGAGICTGVEGRDCDFERYTRRQLGRHVSTSRYMTCSFSCVSGQRGNWEAASGNGRLGRVEAVWSNMAEGLACWFHVMVERTYRCMSGSEIAATSTWTERASGQTRNDFIAT